MTLPTPRPLGRRDAAIDVTVYLYGGAENAGLENAGVAKIRPGSRTKKLGGGLNQA